MGKEEINTWVQGEYIDKNEYINMPEEWKENNRIRELTLVRPSMFGNAICNTQFPEDAVWIAERLNFASNICNKISSISLKNVSPSKKLELILELIRVNKEYQNVSEGVRKINIQNLSSWVEGEKQSQI